MREKIKMTETYKKNATLKEKQLEESRLIRCLLERLLNSLDASGFVDYQFEKFGKGFKGDTHKK